MSTTITQNQQRFLRILLIASSLSISHQHQHQQQSSSMQRPLQNCDLPLLTKSPNSWSSQPAAADQPCPHGSVRGGTWIQTQLGAMYVITKIVIHSSSPTKKSKLVTDQCFDVEYTRRGIPGQTNRFISYTAQQSPDGIDHLAKYAINDRTGSSLLTISLDPKIIATTVRLSPCNQDEDDSRKSPENPADLCVRFEMFGCKFTDGVLSYEYLTLPDLMDDTFDGINSATRTVEPGLGQLTDGTLGSDNYAANTVQGRYDWVGWKNHSLAKSPLASILFTFDSSRNFSHVMIHSNNYFTHGVELLDRAVVTFSELEPTHESCSQTPLGRLEMPPPSSSTPAQQKIKSIFHKEARDHNFDMARPVMINLDHKVGQCVRIDLYGASQWLLISEVIFESAPVPMVRPSSVFQSSESPIIAGGVVNHTTILGLGMALCLSLILLVSIVVAWLMKSPRRTHCDVEDSIEPYDQTTPMLCGAGGKSMTTYNHHHHRHHHNNNNNNNKNALIRSCSGGNNNSSNIDRGSSSIYSSGNKTAQHHPFCADIQNELEMFPSHFGYGRCCAGGCTTTTTTVGNSRRTVSSAGASPRVPPYNNNHYQHHHNYVLKHQFARTNNLLPLNRCQSASINSHHRCGSCQQQHSRNNESDAYTYPSLPALQPMCSWPNTFSSDLSSSAIRLIDAALTLPNMSSTHCCPCVRAPIYKHIGQDLNIYQYVTIELRQSCLVKTLRPTAAKSARNSFEQTANMYQYLLRDSNVSQNVSAFVANANVVINDRLVRALIIDYPNDGMDLRTFLTTQFGPSTLNDDDIQRPLTKAIAQLTKALSFLESINCLHCDVAMHSCMAAWTNRSEKSFWLKLIDYGLMNRPGAEPNYYRFIAPRLVDSSMMMMMTQTANGEPCETNAGVVCYQIPLRWIPFDLIANSDLTNFEAITSSKPYTLKSTVWALGVTMWEILQLGNHVPYQQFTDQQLIDCASTLLTQNENVLCCVEHDLNQNNTTKWSSSAIEFLNQPTFCSDPLFELVGQCLNFKEDERPNWTDILGRIDESDSPQIFIQQQKTN